MAQTPLSGSYEDAYCTTYDDWRVCKSLLLNFNENAINEFKMLTTIKSQKLGS